MNERSLYAYRYYLNRGYSPAAAAGITGNLMVESGRFADDVIAGKRRGDQGSAGYAAQWRGPRLQGYYNYAQSQGLDPSSLDAQLGYVDHEMRTGSDGGAAVAFRKLQSAQTPDQAAQYFMNHFERPNADPSVNHIGLRQQYANSLYTGAPATGTTPANTAIAAQAAQSQGLASLAPSVAGAIPTLNAGVTQTAAAPAADPMGGIFGMLLQSRMAQPAPVAMAAPIQRKAPDTRSEEEKMASVSQTPDFYLKRMKRRV